MWESENQDESPLMTTDNFHGIDRLASPQESLDGQEQPNPCNSTRKPATLLARREGPKIVHTSVYLPEAVHEALRKAAFEERVKIHDIVISSWRFGSAVTRRWGS